jgi:hypothetical protein
MIRWKSAALGAAVFGAAHLVLTARWREWFQPGGDFPPWFLNSGRAVALTAALLFMGGVVVGLTTRGPARESIVAGGNLAAGAIVAMCLVLALTGPGTLFPIALTIGAGVVVISIAAGAMAGSAIRKGYRGQ